MEKSIWFFGKNRYIFYIPFIDELLFMKNKFFDSIVKDLVKTKHKIISIDKIRKLFSGIMWDLYHDKKMYKLLYYLKNRWYLVNLKKNIYFIKLPEEEYSEQRFVDRFYWDLVKQHCKQYLKSDRYIWWLKALELHMSVFDVPDEITIVNAHKQATEVIMLDKKVLFKSYMSHGKNLYPLYKKHITKIDLWRISVPVICMEIALLESLYNPSVVYKWYIEGLAKKLLKKYKNILDPDIRALVVKNNKHHSSLNRLYTLAQSIDKKLADAILQVIKKYSYDITL